jgi:hypothetical protein
MWREKWGGRLFMGLKMAFHDDCLALWCFFIEQIWMWKCFANFLWQNFLECLLLNFDEKESSEQDKFVDPFFANEMSFALSRQSRNFHSKSRQKL